MVLNEETCNLTTFGTPIGRYKWKRMPFGISPAPEVFQRRLNQALEVLNNIYVMANDILVTGGGSTLEEARTNHDRNLLALRKRCRDKGIKLNKEKFRLREPQVTYMGYILTENGLKPDPEKVHSILHMPKPENVENAWRLLAWLTIYQDICRNLLILVSQ